MKKLIFFITFLFTYTFIFAQQAPLPKKIEKGNLIEVITFYEDGTVMQQGSYTKEGKLHGVWESYYQDGSRKAQAKYNKGVKVGTWTYWDSNFITKIVYDNNTVVKVEKIAVDELNSKEN